MIETSATEAPRPSGRGAARRSALFEQLVALLVGEGFARLTLDDLAARLHCSKRTLYGLAGSKEQLVRAAVVHFFRRATTRVEAVLAAETDPARRLAAYLRAVSAELAPVSPRFFDDVAAFGPAAEVYERNTRAAAGRVQQLIEEGVRAGVFREVHVTFAADVIASVMVRIQQRQVAAATGLADAEAYEHLAELLLNGLTRP
ncbi:TetR/AcrR family transcriptional regulator [Streptomyces sp. NBC_01216]|uniref:TetR/AcrR family transcriptional regulator n=1 Tax=unclassified Streptomyces TaxID=2593676 RepID=UPI002E1279CF|nr:TetR/AcrR family transcriptional regulator [Streptomyces sp. NBC_01216]